MAARALRQVWILCPLLALALLAGGCAVNPVPTPGTSGSLAAGGESGGDANDTSFATADAVAANDVAQADAKASDATDSGVPTVAVTTLSAVSTDPAIDPGPAGGLHVVASAQGVAETGKLVVFLPDAGHVATDYMSLAAAAAQQGHRVLVLATPVHALTPCGADLACMGLARLEQLDGQDRTAAVQVGVHDALEHRIYAAVATLEAQHPGAGWGTFYAGSAPVWSKLAMAGHGEGASLAAAAAMQHGVWRVAVLAGPVDGAPGQAPDVQAAAWLAAKSSTPAAAWRGFLHTADASLGVIGAAWTLLGLDSQAAWFNLDSGQTPGISTHLLTTAGNLPDPHAGVATDAALPTDAAALAAVRAGWTWLFWPL